MSLQAWQSLHRELERWQAAGKTLSLWWRDDDAVACSDELSRLLDLSEAYTHPLSLAVIPANLEGSLTLRISANELVSCLLHGYSHQNHAPSGSRKQELGDHRAPKLIMHELMTGNHILHDAFTSQYLPVVVPPWNRISSNLINLLPDFGFVGLSTLGPRLWVSTSNNGPSLTINNVHVDIIDWKQRSFAGDEKVLGQLVNHLQQRRTGSHDPLEATGIMTHHLAHDLACWNFLEQLFDALKPYDCINWPTAKNIFPYANQPD